MAGHRSSDPTWYALHAVEAPPRGRLSLDTDVDVCVVGGGLAGLTAAREIARRGWSVVLLESRHVGAAASGRNCGFVLPGFHQSLAAIVERVGFDTARALWALSEAGLDYVRDAIVATGMPGVPRVDGWLDVSKQDNGDAALRQLQLLGEIGADVEGWPVERVRDALRSPCYFHAIHHPRAFHINPHNYALGLAAAAEAEGVRIFEATPVLELDPAGVRKRLVTPSARVRAGHVVLAGNVDLGRLMPDVHGTALPLTTYVGVTAPLGAKLHDLVRYSGAVSDSDHVDSHYRIVGGDRLMWAGRMTAWAGKARRHEKQLAREIGRIYPALGQVRFDHVWSGTIGRPIHAMPQIGELQPGVWLAAGFGGHGLNTSALAGQLIAEALVEGDDSWLHFEGYELIWAGGLAGRATAQVAYWARRALERFGRRRSRSGKSDAPALAMAGHDPGAGEPAEATPLPPAAPLTRSERPSSGPAA